MNWLFDYSLCKRYKKKGAGYISWQKEEEGTLARTQRATVREPRTPSGILDSKPHPRTDRRYSAPTGRPAGRPVKEADPRDEESGGSMSWEELEAGLEFA
ncbi:MAG: hypothetical protein COU11_02250 [Candidatus Harrisonbacteria bacterium CG10_big_fil_rev_8_21_14_0_10_49_15]|uniref:Uncharacterized protein n=1 Tax=Candidatus Harrisonbacteria bacterium CG10_big_fil_rev_8_21_14_0_10_49_15 TaxID=1974587 RepID=A0A2H0UKU3_9BACT|nr:MAG: hypothetical protein COU11_02250 [Candidatus Harrisonbacteria bacterium CG10_big_fil_rev_8_21_14_0_10_49_15]